MQSLRQARAEHPLRLHCTTHKQVKGKWFERGTNQTPVTTPDKAYSSIRIMQHLPPRFELLKPNQIEHTSSLSQRRGRRQQKKSSQRQKQHGRKMQIPDSSYLASDDSQPSRRSPCASPEPANPPPSPLLPSPSAVPPPLSPVYSSSL